MSAICRYATIRSRNERSNQMRLSKFQIFCTLTHQNQAKIVCFFRWQRSFFFSSILQLFIWLTFLGLRYTCMFDVIAWMFGNTFTEWNEQITWQIPFHWRATKQMNKCLEIELQESFKMWPTIMHTWKCEKKKETFQNWMPSYTKGCGSQNQVINNKNIFYCMRRKKRSRKKLCDFHEIVHLQYDRFRVNMEIKWLPFDGHGFDHDGTLAVLATMKWFVLYDIVSTFVNQITSSTMNLKILKTVQFYSSKTQNANGRREYLAARKMDHNNPKSCE